MDYKTGRPPVDREGGAGEVVLRLYLEGAREAWAAAPRGATLEYVLDGDVRQVHPDPAATAAALDAVRRVADDISAGRFDPAPGWHCRGCDFALLCPAMDR